MKNPHYFMTPPIGRISAWMSALLLSACASAPPPDWQANAFEALNAYASAYLDGNVGEKRSDSGRVADAEWARAKAALASTGRPDLMARAELRRCAVHTASLAFEPCTGYLTMAADAMPADRTYAAFIRGDWVGLNKEHLPQHYRALLDATTIPTDTNRLSSIADPLARLIAAAVLLQKKQITPIERAVAVDTASAQGWRRPLLGWLLVQGQQAEQTGDAGTSASLQRRIDLVMQTRSEGLKTTPD